MLLDIVKKGSVDRGVTLRIIDSTDGTPETGVVYNTSGIDLWYRRQGGAKVSITEATLSALTDAHSDGGFLHIGDGVYRLDLPDAAFASGAQWVDVGGTVTGMIVIGGRVRLVDFDLEAALTVGAIADGVCDEVLTGHGISNSLAVHILAIAAGQTTIAGQTTPSSLRQALGMATDDMDDQLEAIIAAAVAAAAQTAASAIRAALGMAAADLDTQLDAVAAASAGTVSADIVDRSRTWIGEGYRARNIVEVEDGFAGTLCLVPDLNPGVTLATVSSVSITGAATVTATDLTVDRSKTRAHFTVPALTTTGTYTVKVVVTTVDGDTIGTTATLKVY